MSTPSSPPTNPNQPYIHTDHTLNREPWLHLQKFKYYLQNLPKYELHWRDFPVTSEDEANINAAFSLIDIRHSQELTAADTENLLNSLLLGLIYRDIDRAILARPFDDPELYNSSLPPTLTHMTTEPQPLTTESLPSPLPTTSTATSAIIQSDDNPLRHQPYRLRNPCTTIIDLSTDEDHPRDVVVEEKIHWRKKPSTKKHHCRLCRETTHATYNCWTFQCPFCNDKAPRHWARNCPKKPSGSVPLRLNTPYDNDVVEPPSRSNPLCVITAYNNLVKQICHLSPEL